MTFCREQSQSNLLSGPHTKARLDDFAVYGRPSLLHDFPQEVAPWSRWRPDGDVHSLQTSELHRAQMTMLLVGKRLELAKGVTVMVLRFVSTR